MEVEQKKRKPREVPKIRKKKQPSVAEVERAIGAGIFRDRDPRGIGENPTIFDKILTNPLDKEEGLVEKKLRETSEWILNTTEWPSRTGGLLHPTATSPNSKQAEDLSEDDMGNSHATTG